jgi:hypothetical protein
MINDDDVILFLHIPKTAGLSLISYLDSQFSSEQIFPLHSARNPEMFLAYKPEQMSKYRLIRGHHRFGPFDERIYKTIVQNPLIMTILRDPVARTISAYRHYLRTPESALHDELVSEGITLKQYVSYPKYAHKVDNRQTRLIVGEYRSRQKDEIRCMKLSDEALLRVAKQKLEQFAFIGLTERFEESLHLLTYTFGWPAPSEMPLLNVSPIPATRDSVTEDVIEAIEERTKLDMELYRFAELLFEERLNQMAEEKAELRKR